MNYEEIKKLIDDMGNSKIDELEIEFPEGMKISMKKETGVANNSIINTSALNVENSTISNGSHENKAEKQEDCHIITSPMVGTFYASSSPKEEPFVKVGDKVRKGQVLCVVEAMKLMNEIESEQDGEVVEICVKNEQMVEFDQPLFKIK